MALDEDAFREWYEKVPEPGDGHRWYDPLYRILIALTRTAVWKRLPGWFRGWIVGVINRIHGRNDLEREQLRDPADPEHNVVLPDNERVEYPALWTCELYTPSYVGNLLEGLQKNGWQSGPTLAPGGDVINLISRSRTADWRGWSLIVELVDVDSPRYPRWPKNRVKLPSNFDSIELNVYALTSSLTAVVATFVLKDQARGYLEDAVSSPREPRRIVVDGHQVLRGREFVGFDMVQEVRAAMHHEVRAWLAERLPGVFATESLRNMPVCDAVIRYVDDLRDSSGLSSDRNYLRALGLDHIVEATSDRLPGVHLTEYAPSLPHIKWQDAWCVSGRFNEMFADQDYFFNGERTIEGMCFALDRAIRPIMTRLALTSLLAHVRRQSAQSRDLVRSTYGSRPVRSAVQLRNLLLQRSWDLVSVCREVEAFTENDRAYLYDVVPFKQHYVERIQEMDESSGAPKFEEDFFEQLRSAQRLEAAALREVDAEAREVLSTVASLNASIDGIRVQRWAVAVAVTSAVIALVAIWVSVAVAAGGGQ